MTEQIAATAAIVFMASLVAGSLFPKEPTFGATSNFKALSGLLILVSGITLAVASIMAVWS